MKKAALCLISSFILFTFNFINAPTAVAQSLDSTFGVKGKIEVSFGVNVAPGDAALQSDGKIIVVGATDNFQIANQVFGVTRFLSNGSVDTTFGNRGTAITAFTNFVNTPNAVVIQPDGKIVVAGETQSSDDSLNRFAVARFNSNGTLDTTFGGSGRVTTEFFSVTFGGVRELADVILLQPDGKILVAGVAIQGARLPIQSALARYNPNGSLDSTFGNGGKVVLKSIGMISALALLSDGQILASNNVGSMAQFDASGTLASAVTSGTIAARANTGVSAFESSGKLVIAGSAQGTTRHDIDITMVGFNPTGSIDHNFSNPVFDFTGENTISSDSAQILAIQPDGKIVAGGLTFSSTTGSSVFGVARVNTNGTLDSTFGTGGVLTTSFEGADQVTSILIQPDGKILAIGQAFNGSTGLANLAMARYLP